MSNLKSVFHYVLFSYVSDGFINQKQSRGFQSLGSSDNTYTSAMLEINYK